MSKLPLASDDPPARPFFRFFAGLFALLMAWMFALDVRDALAGDTSAISSATGAGMLALGFGSIALTGFIPGQKKKNSN